MFTNRLFIEGSVDRVVFYGLGPQLIEKTHPSIDLNFDESDLSSLEEKGQGVRNNL